MAKQRIKFKVDEDEIIRQIIFKQAGTSEKALLEGIMNSVDAEGRVKIVAVN